MGMFGVGAGLNLGTATAYFTIDLSGFDQGIDRASESLTKVQNNTATAMDKWTAAGNALVDVGSTIAKKTTVPVVGLGIAATKTGSDFEKAMSAVQSKVIMTTDYTDDKFEELAKYARKMGKDTIFSASEAADALGYMGQAGWSLGEMFDGLKPILDLAAASQEDLALTSDIVTDALTGFGMSSNETRKFVDQLAAAAMGSNTDVAMLGESFKYVAPVAGAFGFTSADVALSLGLMANSGIKASQAGTSLRAVMANLANPVGQSAAAVEELGLNITNADGTTRDWRDIMDELRAKLGGATTDVKEMGDRLAYVDEQFASGAITEEEYEERIMAIATAAYADTDARKVQLAAMLAGKTGMSGFLALLNANQKEYEELADSIDGATTAFDGQGAAAKMVSVATDNLWGDTKKLGSAWEELKIVIYDLIKEDLRDFVQALTRLINKFLDMDESTQKTIIKVLEFVAAFGTVAITVGKVITTIIKIIEFFGKFKTAISLVGKALGIGGAAEGAAGAGLIGAIKGLGSVLLKVAGGAISAFVGAVGTIPAIIIVVVAAVVGIFVLLYNKCDWFKEKVNGIASSIADFFKSIPEKLSNLGSWLGEKLSGILETIGEWKDKIIEKAKEIGEGFVESVREKFNSVKEKISEGLEKAKEKISEWKENVIELAKKVADGFSEKMEQLGEAVNKIKEKLGEALESVKEWAGGMIDKAKEAVSGFVDKIKEGFDKVKEKISDGLERAKETITEWKDNVVELAKNAAEGFNEKIEQLKEVAGKVKEKLGDALEKAKDWVKDMKDKAKEAAEGFVNNVKEKLSPLKDKVKNALNSAKEKAENFRDKMKDIAKEAGDKFNNNIIEPLKDLSGKLKEKFNSGLNAAKEFASDLWGKAKEAGQGFVDNIEEKFSMVKEKVSTALTNTINSVKDWAKEMKDSAEKTVKEFVDKFVNGLKDMGSKVKDKFKAVVNKVKELGSDMFEAGKHLVQKVIDGIGSMAKSAANAVKDLFKSDDSTAKNVVSSAKNPRAVGVDYVPYNGYGATLHEGEMVLTKEEAEAYRKGMGGNGSNGDGDTFVFQSPKAIDEREAARLFKQTKRQLKLGF